MRTPESDRRDDRDDALEQLVADGLLERRGAQLRTTRRWQSAMARAAFRLLCEQGDGEDLRVPIVVALVELYGDTVPSDRLVMFVDALLTIECRELDPVTFVR